MQYSHTLKAKQPQIYHDIGTQLTDNFTQVTQLLSVSENSTPVTWSIITWQPFFCADFMKHSDSFWG